jgi:hypothetical protein
LARDFTTAPFFSQGEFSKVQKLIMIFCLIVGTASAADFKNVDLNQPITIEQARAAFGIESLEPGVHHGFTELLGLTVSTHVTIDATRRVTRLLIGFKPAFYDAIHAVAMRKWGEPTKLASEPMSNAFGASVLVTQTDWIYGDAKIMLINYYGSLDQGLLSIDVK